MFCVYWAVNISAVQDKKAVTAYLSSKQLPPFGVAYTGVAQILRVGVLFNHPSSQILIFLPLEVRMAMETKGFIQFEIIRNVLVSFI